MLLWDLRQENFPSMKNKLLSLLLAILMMIVQTWMEEKTLHVTDINVALSPDESNYRSPILRKY